MGIKGAQGLFRKKKYWNYNFLLFVSTETSKNKVFLELDSKKKSYNQRLKLNLGKLASEFWFGQ
jgi:hypothetical protein